MAALGSAPDAIPAQLLGDHLARRRGLTPGTFRLEQPDTRLGPDQG